VSSPDLLFFGFCFIFFILYHFAPQAREYIFGFYAVIFVCLCFIFVGRPACVKATKKKSARFRALWRLYNFREKE